MNAMVEKAQSQMGWLFGVFKTMQRKAANVNFEKVSFSFAGILLLRIESMKK